MLRNESQKVLEASPFLSFCRLSPMGHTSPPKMLGQGCTAGLVKPLAEIETRPTVSNAQISSTPPLQTTHTAKGNPSTGAPRVLAKEPTGPMGGAGPSGANASIVSFGRPDLKASAEIFGPPGVQPQSRMTMVFLKIAASSCQKADIAMAAALSAKRVSHGARLRNAVWISSLRLFTISSTTCCSKGRISVPSSIRPTTASARVSA